MEDVRGNEKSKSRASIEIAQRTAPLAVIYFLLFIAIILCTSIYKRMPESTVVFGFFICMSTFASAFLSTKIQRLNSDYSETLRQSFFFSLVLVAAVWGGFCSFTLVYFEMDWTTFFIILVTIAVSSGQVATISPNFKLQIMFQTFLLGPSVFVNFFKTGGIQGVSIGSFFLAFWVLSLVLGRIQYNQFWQIILENSKIQAVLHGLPGTLAWVSNSGEYVGVNSKHAELWGLTSQDFVGQEIGFTGQNTDLKKLATHLFTSKEERASKLMDRNNRKFFVAGQKYNFGQSAVLLGIDVSDQHLVQEQLEFQRAQSQNTARIACLGEIFRSIIEEYEFPISDIEAQLKKIGDSRDGAKLEEEMTSLKKFWQLLHDLSSLENTHERIEISPIDILEEIKFLSSHRAKKCGVDLTWEIEKSDKKIFVNKIDLLVVLLNILNNAFEAIREVENKKIHLSGSFHDGNYIFHVADSGEGVEEVLEEVIFEPNFTTKKPEESTGLGLSLAKEIMQEHGGSISVARVNDETRFEVRVPVQSASSSGA